ncbi:MAG TPA: AAA family ATPase [Thermomicrobiales bacterium]|nr:AAA family ATPase [Thermomicrobiales bacterium]
MRVLITGMSGAGKSTVTAELTRRGYPAVDLDSPAYSHLVPAKEGEQTGIGGGMDWVWNESLVAGLLDTAGDEPLFLSGCSPNQGQFAGRFDHVILLTAPTETIRDRLANRTTNDFGKSPAELANTLVLIGEIEPLLRRSADLVIDTTAPLDDVVRRVMDTVGLCP